MGGQDAAGSDAVNRLSHLIIKAVAQTHLPQPNLTIRYHRGLSDDFMRTTSAASMRCCGTDSQSDGSRLPVFAQKERASSERTEAVRIG